MTAKITWNVQSDDPCEQCAGRDGQEYTIQTLPGWPGDGTFGGSLCLGGPNCMCTLEYSDDSGNTMTGTNTLREQSLSGALSADMGPMGHVDQWIAGRQAFNDALPDIVQPNEVYSAQARAVMRTQVRLQLARELGINPADVSARSVADRVPAVYKSMKGDIKIVFDLLNKNYPKKSFEWIGQMAWSFRDVEIEKISVTGPSTDQDAKTIRKMAKKMRKGKPIKPLILIDPGDKGLLQVADGHHRATAALEANKQKVPAYVGRPQTEDDWRKEVMYMQIARAKKGFHGILNGWPDFESSGIGETSLPFMPGGGYVAKLLEDPSADPVAHSLTIDDSNDDIDGVEKNFSVGMGLAPFDLSGPDISIKFAGLMLMAIDSGRVLMLQRSLDEDDPAAGMWEMPGGHLEEDEQALDAAIREWQEEVGSELPPVKVVGRWACPNGYMGFLALCKSESDVDIHAREIEDPDGDGSEAIAWFWPADLISMPGVRQETRDNTPWARIVTRTVKP